MTYTPGPWGYDGEIIYENTPGEQENHTGFWWVYTTDEANINIAKVENLTESESNARLMAASPDLLEAAVALLHEIDQIYDVDDQIPNISSDIMEKVPALQTAIAKAKESQS